MYRIDDAARQRVRAGDVFPPGWAVAILDGAEAGTRAGFFTAIARELRFPDYFGHNWDAVYDCLTDFNWLPAAGYGIVLDGYGALATAQPEQWQIALKVLGEASAFWQATNRPMVVLLYGPEADAPDVPILPADCLPVIQQARASGGA
jgi:RNAse (barnase) inhibitor barstar